MLGLALEGGGAKGSYHAGAVKAFCEIGITFEGVAGTSIGAVNAAIIAQGEPEKLIAWWEELAPSHLFDLTDEEIRKFFLKQHDKKSIKHLIKFLGSGIVQGGLSPAGFLALIKEIIDEDKLRESPIDFCLVTMSLTDKMPLELFKEDIPYGMLHEYILASAYFPAFKLNALNNGKRYIDGGLYNNLPIVPLARRGYDEIYAVRTMSNMPHIPIIDDTVKVHYVIPTDSVGNTFSLTLERVKNNMNMGYWDTKRVLHGYLGEQFYIESLTDEEFCLLLNSFSDTMIEKIMNRLDLQTDNKWEVYDAFFNVITKQLKLEITLTEKEKFILLLDKFSRKTGLDRYKLRTLTGFLEDLRNYYGANAEPTSILPRLSEELYCLVINHYKD